MFRQKHFKGSMLPLRCFSVMKKSRFSSEKDLHNEKFSGNTSFFLRCFLFFWKKSLTFIIIYDIVRSCGDNMFDSNMVTGTEMLRSVFADLIV